MGKQALHCEIMHTEFHPAMKLGGGEAQQVSGRMCSITSMYSLGGLWDMLVRNLKSLMPPECFRQHFKMEILLVKIYT